MDARAPPLEDDPWIDEPSEGDYEPPSETDESGTDPEDAYEEALEDLEEAMLHGEGEDDDNDGTDTETMDLDGLCIRPS